MKTNAKRVLSMLLMLLLIYSLAVPAFAAIAPITPNKGTVTVYLNSASNNNQVFNITLASGGYNFKIKRASVKIIDQGTTGATIYSFGKKSSSSQAVYTNLDPDKSTYYEYTVGLRVTGKGTATLKYKIEDTGKTYTLKVKVLPYTNPVKSCVISYGDGVKKNLAKRTAGKNSADPFQFSSNLKDVIINLKAADGWRIGWVEVLDNGTGLSRKISDYYSNGMTSAKISWGTMKANHWYTVTANLINTKNNANLMVSYSIRGTK